MTAASRHGRQGRAGCAAAPSPAPLVIVALAIVALALLWLGAAGCGGAATDANEPNDELGAATTLAPGTPVDGVVGADDGDVFGCEAPGGAGTHPFVVTLLTDAPEDVELEVGASIPDAWEAITWPGWDPVAEDDRIVLEGSLRNGTVLMFVTGAEGAAYSIAIAWE